MSPFAPPEGARTSGRARAAAAASTAPRPDFLRPTARAGALAWAWLATALLVLGASAWEACTAWQARAEVRAQHGAWTARRQAASRPAPPAAPPPADTAALNHLRQRLDYPWASVWRAAEAASVADVAWLSLAHRQGGALALEGHAAQAPAALAAATALRQQPGWQRVLLGRLERDDSGQAFGLSAQPESGAASPVLPSPAAAATPRLGAKDAQ